MSNTGQSATLNATRASRLHEICGLAPRLFVSLPARSLLGLIWLYRHSLSPVLPVVCGPGCGCRFHPTCAVYSAEAVRTHGAVRGSWLTVRRLLKCHPLHPGGFDPVPNSPVRGPICRAVFSPVTAPGRPVTPVSDWQIHRSKTGATPGCGISRCKEYSR